MYIAVSMFCKRINGEAPDAGNAVGVWMENGGVRMCGDSDILISAARHGEFVQPYQRRVLEAFGGGWLHYCGGMPGFSRAEGLHLHDVYSRNEHIRGLNWTTAGDWVGEMKRLKGLGLVHIGTLPRDGGEPLADYFRRALGPYDGPAGMVSGMIWQGPWLKAEEVDGAMDAWHRVQEEVFG